MPPEGARAQRRRPGSGMTAASRAGTRGDHPRHSPGSGLPSDAGPSRHAAADGRAGGPAFAVGDVVVCPHHGLGTVVERSVRELVGARREYLTIELECASLTLLIPTAETDGARLRPAATPPELRRALDGLTGPATRLSDNWQHRRKEALRKLGSADVVAIAEVVRDLADFGASKPLALRDYELYTKARELLESELKHVLRMSEARAAAEIDRRRPAPSLAR
jgi:CarD family transcriptional regulator, regulator of rRNA transcription